MVATAVATSAAKAVRVESAYISLTFLNPFYFALHAAQIDCSFNNTFSGRFVVCLSTFDLKGRGKIRSGRANIVDAGLS